MFANIGPVIRKELKSYFNSPIAYVVVVTFLVFSFVEARRLGMQHWWVWPLLTFGIAFAFAFPLFLYFRDRRIEVIGQRSGSR